jgi:hypothetical protein
VGEGERKRDIGMETFGEFEKVWTDEVEHGVKRSRTG